MFNLIKFINDPMGLMLGHNFGLSFLPCSLSIGVNEWFLKFFPWDGPWKEINTQDRPRSCWECNSHVRPIELPCRKFLHSYFHLPKKILIYWKWKENATKDFNRKRRKDKHVDFIHMSNKNGPRKLSTTPDNKLR